MHPSRDELAGLVFGTLIEDRADSVADHVEDCPQCEETVRELESTSDEVVHLLRQPVVEHPFEQESGCRRVVEVAAAMGRGSSFGSEQPNVAVHAIPEDLGMLCEYRLLSKLGQGGMGTVYRALHTKLDKTVAVKVLPSDKLQDARAVSRFEREMKAVGKLDHPNIVRALDAREVDGQHFLVMEYVSGLDLSQLVHRRGALPIPEACEIIRQAAHGLQYAHTHGLVHRDIKPSNLMLSVVKGLESRVQSSGAENSVRLSTLDPRLSTPTVKILDLGLALLQPWQAQAEEADELTGSGQMMGTLDYMAPEQGTDSHHVDIRADIYSLGATLYKLLCGAAPFAAKKYDTPVKKMMALATEPVAPIRERRSDVPDELAAVLDRMLARNPEERYATAAEVIAALEPFTAGCDLSGLLAKAEETVESVGAADKSLTPTDEHVSSALEGTTSSEPAPARPAPLASRRRWKPLAVAVGLMLVAIGAVGAWQITIIIRDPEGRERTFQTSEKDTIIIKPNDREIARLPGQDEPKQVHPSKLVREHVPRPKPVRIDIEPEPVVIKGGDPLSSVALVTRPTPLPGVHSWTVETREQRGCERLGGESGWINAMAYRPDGSLLATAGGDGTIRLRDPKNGRPVKLLVRHGPPIRSMAWLGDGRILASLDCGCTGWFWDIETGRAFRAFKSGHGYGMAASPDGKILAVTQEEHPRGMHTAFLDVESGEQLKRHGPPGEYQLSWSPGGGVLASWTGGTRPAGHVLLWAAESGQTLHTLDDAWGSVVWSPDGRMMASRCSDGIGVWDAQSGERIRVIEQSGHVAWSPDGEMLAVMDGEYLRIWDVKSGTRLREMRAAEKCRQPRVSWSPDGNTIVSAGGDLLCFWEADSGKPRHVIRLKSQGFSFAWSPQGELAAASSRDGAVLLGDLESGSPLVSLAGSSRVFHWSPDGRTLATGTPIDASVQLWDARAGKSIRVLKDDEEPATELAWSPGGKTIAATVADGTKVHLWDVGAARRSSTLKGGGTAMLTWSPDGRTLATGGGNMKRTIYLWDAGSGQLIGKLDGCSNWLTTLAWSPNAKILASISRTIQLWDVEKQQLLQTLEGYEGVLDNVLAWSLEGKILSVWEDGKIFRIWDIESCKQVASIPHRGRSRSSFLPMALSPDRTILAVASYGGIALCDLRSQEVRNTLALPDPNLGTRFVRWSSDGKQLISGHSDNMVRYWDEAFGLQAKCNQMQPTISWNPTIYGVGRMTLSESGESGATIFSDSIYLWEAKTGDPIGRVVLLPDRQYVFVNPEGHYVATREIEKDLVYVVQTDSGEQLTLAPAEFAEKYGWKNDPEKVVLNLGAPAEPE